MEEVALHLLLGLRSIVFINYGIWLIIATSIASTGVHQVPYQAIGSIGIYPNTSILIQLEPLHKVGSTSKQHVMFMGFQKV